jgi:hypothetical protein
MSHVIASANFSRPADTNAYAVGDLIANSTTAGSVTPMEFKVTASGGPVSLIRVRLRKTGTGVTSASTKLHLWTKSPTVTNGDNGAFLPNQAATYLCAFEVTSMQAFSDGAVGDGIPAVGTLAAAIVPGTTLYGLTEARGAYTPSSGETFTWVLEGV